MAILRSFLAIFVPTIKKIFHKTEVQMVILRRWTGLNHDWYNSYDTKCKKHKNQKKCECVIFYKIAINGNGDICVLSYNFWMNQGSNLFSALEWLSEPQFCEIWSHSYQKMAGNYREMDIYNSLSFPSTLYVLKIWKFFQHFVNSCIDEKNLNSTSERGTTPLW